ncbi:maleylpyruvate isomerase family mycothiol-dependent enzyme [Streptomyces sp. GC420]|uniref:maleylpyruvate isomerase family mycothiol-dependent enzyme n=1 Tax=Streptomyces sp. GC420 TaxID=2697568 RepID=UPI0014151C22|nr:maleylpyruvate isomerase family mycothiol-dependent enzyme [Streptomyces sp. GC420]NBM18443.1 maleylpyruvate isomerase family mycothiol-dependent enzyme [Streptomyces sp. GC420]
MPPARKRTRSYDPAKIRAALTAQFSLAHDLVRDLTPERLALPTRLGDWTVRELAAHIALAVGAVARHLDEPEPPKQEVTLLQWPLSTAARAEGIDERTRELAVSAGPDELFERAGGLLAACLDAAPAERLVSTRVGAMRLGDFLVTRCVELVVHTDDLAAALGTEPRFDRQALAACTRLLADALAAVAPGASTEVRVPPFAVVQCVEGPRHTRGTPPNVVETDPATWIRLATGRTAWADEIAAARVLASGERADLSGLLPIMR